MQIRYNKALAVMQQGHGVTKTVSVAPDSNRCLDYILDQLQNPQTNRPIKALDPTYFRHRFYNPLTDSWIYRDCETAIRGQAKPAKQFTKKTAAAYLPTDGVTQFFQPKHGHGIALMFDLRKCDLKQEKYIFLEDMQTDQRWWIKNTKGHATHRSVGLNKLKEYIAAQRVAKIVPEPSELLLGLSLKGLVAIMVPKNLFVYRAKAIHAQQRIQEKLHIKLPIIVLSDAHLLYHYDSHQRLQDFIEIDKWQHPELPMAFVTQLKTKFSPAFHAKLTRQLNQPTQDFSPFFSELPQDLQLYTIGLLSFVEIAALIMHAEVDVYTREGLSHKLKQIFYAMAPADLLDILQYAKRENRCKDFYWPATPQPYSLLLRKNREILLKLFTTDFYGMHSRLFLHLMLAEINLYKSLTILAKQCLLLVSMGHPDDTYHLRSRIIYPEDRPGYFSNLVFSSIALGDSKQSKWLLENCLEMPISRQRYHGDFRRDYSNRIRSNKSIYLTRCPLFVAALNDKPESVKVFCELYPQAISSSIKEIRRLYQFGECAEYDNGEKKVSGVANAYALLLIARNDSGLAGFSAHEKRLIETYLLKELDKLITVEEVQAFWQQHQNSYYLNYHRHAWFDRFFRTPDYMTLGKQHLSTAVTEKLKALEAVPEPLEYKRHEPG